jgi:hypothetical protein
MARKKEKAATGRSNREDPMVNKSLAIRLVLGKMKGAKASEVAEAVKREYGHDIAVNSVYMAKAKKKVKSRKNAKTAEGKPAATTKMGSASDWVAAIKAARNLLSVAGSADTAIALVKAVEA